MTSTDEKYSFWELVRADAAAAGNPNPSPLYYLAALFGMSRFSMVFLFRIASTLYQKGPVGRKLSKLFTRINGVINGGELSPAARIGPGLLLPHTFGLGWAAITAGKNLTVLHNATFNLRYRDLDGYDPANLATCGDNVQIGPGAAIVGAVHIGDGATITPNSVVFNDIPAGAIATGNPARILRRKSEEEASGE